MWAYGKNKPKYPVLNRAHPLSRDVILAFPFTDGANSDAATDAPDVHDLGSHTRWNKQDAQVVLVYSDDGAAVDFNSNHSGVRIDDRPILYFGASPVNITLLARLRFHSTGRDHILMRQGGTEYAWYYRTASPGSMSFYTAAGETWANAMSLVQDQWYDLACVIDDGAVTHYIDGVAQGNASSGTPSWSDTGNEHLLGELGATQDFDGLMASFVLIGRPFTAREVQAFARAKGGDPYLLFRPSVSRAHLFTAAAAAPTYQPRPGATMLDGIAIV